MFERLFTGAKPTVLMNFSEMLPIMTKIAERVFYLIIFVWYLEPQLLSVWSAGSMYDCMGFHCL